jgi:hypothetical protein
MSREFGFEVIFYWQPLRATSGKQLTPWERSITSPRGYREWLVRCTRAADEAMTDRRGRTFFPLQSVFDRETTSIFLDDFGHVTEQGNAILADTIAQAIMTRLAGRVATEGQP